MTFKKLLVGAAVGAAMLSSPAVLAGSLTGNIGVVSDYMFRGIDQTASGPAVQGGVDYAVGNGLYAGTWASNVAGGNELDIYGGYTGAFGDISYDLGAIYYAYTEAKEPAGGTDINTPEVYAGIGFGPISAKAYYSWDAAHTGDASFYVTASASLAFSDTLSLVPEVGFFSLDAAGSKDVTDYSLTLVKTLKDDLSASFAVIGTDLDPVTAGGGSDKPKFVVSLKKSFSL